MQPFIILVVNALIAATANAENPLDHLPTTLSSVFNAPPTSESTVSTSKCPYEQIWKGLNLLQRSYGYYQATSNEQQDSSNSDVTSANCTSTTTVTRTHYVPEFAEGNPFTGSNAYGRDAFEKNWNQFYGQPTEVAQDGVCTAFVSVTATHTIPSGVHHGQFVHTGFLSDLPSGFPTDFPTGFPSGMPPAFHSGFPTGVPSAFAAQMTGGEEFQSPGGLPRPQGGFPQLPSGFPTDYAGFAKNFPDDLPTSFPAAVPTFVVDYVNELKTVFPTGLPTNFVDLVKELPTTFPSGFPTPIAEIALNFQSRFASSVPPNFPTNFPLVPPNRGFGGQFPQGGLTGAPTGALTGVPAGSPSDLPSGQASPDVSGGFQGGAVGTPEAVSPSAGDVTNAPSADSLPTPNYAQFLGN
ncbi:PT repeat family protein [Sugiyamaella lignohabitans]|uniref:PT repeat family protein n=1 Tax=Sugiyamaella lignohabitans TaxID=796027 RepID=A0A167C7R6_9ASCO|nr:PT repeat family protein [Sugiyamaella lignohabitans]ANB11326.1 PT repeat family protein [Sugiyamaella lignohabitans]